MCVLVRNYSSFLRLVQNPSFLLFQPNSSSQDLLNDPQGQQWVVEAKFHNAGFSFQIYCFPLSFILRDDSARLYKERHRSPSSSLLLPFYATDSSFFLSFFFAALGRTPTCSLMLQCNYYLLLSLPCNDFSLLLALVRHRHTATAPYSAPTTHHSQAYHHGHAMPMGVSRPPPPVVHAGYSQPHMQSNASASVPVSTHDLGPMRGRILAGKVCSVFVLPPDRERKQ